ncbi:hypothetical protein [Neptuniibacter sp. QD37_11]|uniref:hypothetical protein n=1 Tax=Neptuniibacter sp. QD37_11 TaxID=3398209 RepID=UPI0039F45240
MGIFKKKEDKSPEATVEDVVFSADEAVNLEHIDDLPQNLYIGHMSNMKKSDLDAYVRGLAEEKFDSLRIVKYGMVKFGGGFLYEVHEGGAGKGIIKSLIKALKDTDESEFIIPTADRWVKVVRKDNGIVCYLLPDNAPQDEGLAPSASIQYKDSLKPMVNGGYGFMVFGIVFGVIGALFATGGAVAKYLVIDKKEVVERKVFGKDTPLNQISELIKYSTSEHEYVVAMKYENGAWTFDTGRLEERIESEVMSDPEEELIRETEELMELKNDDFMGIEPEEAAEHEVKGPESGMEPNVADTPEEMTFALEGAELPDEIDVTRKAKADTAFKPKNTAKTQ